MNNLYMKAVPKISDSARIINQPGGSIEIHSFHKILVFSGTSAAIIKNINGVNSVEKIVENLSSVYSGNEISNDVVNFIQAMADKRIVTYME